MDDGIMLYSIIIWTHAGSKAIIIITTNEYDGYILFSIEILNNNY